jgi:hypothetical protein
MPNGASRASKDLTGKAPVEPQKEAVPQETPSVNLGSKRTIPANFSATQLEEIKKIIRDDIALIKQELEAEGFYAMLDSCEKNYNAVHNDDNSSVGASGYDIRLPIQKLLVRLLVSRAIRQTFQADPLILLEQEGAITSGDLYKRQNRLDFCLRNSVRWEEVNDSIYEHAIYEPVAISKTIEAYEQEELTTLRSYAPTEKDIKRFILDFQDNLTDPESDESKMLKELLSGIPVTIPVTESKVIYSGPRVYRVDNRNFFARPNIKDFRKQRTLAEQMNFTAADIELRVNNPAYGWDETAVEAIRKAYGQDYHTATIPFYEAIVQYSKDGKRTRRYIVTIESKTEEVVRAILYTQEEISYTAHSVSPRDNSWIGESILPMINELVDMVCSIFNYMLYANDVGHTPIILTNDPKAITRRAIQLGVVNIIPFDKDSTFQTAELMAPGFDRQRVITLLMDLIALLSGIDAQLLSGAETPGDPQAPYAKAALKMQVTSMRIEDMIIRLQYADAIVAKKVEKILYSIPDTLDYWTKGKQVEIDRSIYNSPVRYVVHGSKMSFTKQMDLNMVMMFMDILTKLYPGVWADYEVKRALLDVIIQDMGGSVNKLKDVLTAGIDAYIEMQAALAKARRPDEGQPGAEGGPGNGPGTEEGGMGHSAMPDSGTGMPVGGAGGGTIGGGAAQ